MDVTVIMISGRGRCRHIYDDIFRPGRPAEYPLGVPVGLLQRQCRTEEGPHHACPRQYPSCLHQHLGLILRPQPQSPLSRLPYWWAVRRDCFVPWNSLRIYRWRHQPGQPHPAHSCPSSNDRLRVGNLTDPVGIFHWIFGVLMHIHCHWLCGRVVSIVRHVLGEGVCAGHSQSSVLPMGACKENCDATF